jgi:hypothetical protein
MLSIKNLASILAICAAMLSGCTTMQPIRFHSSIDSLARPDAAAKKRYVLMPGGKDVDVGDLQFQEFASYIDKVLTESGFVKAPTFQEADVAIFLAYAIGDPQTYQYTYSLPTWGKTGVSSANTYGTVSSYGNSATYSGTTTYTPTYGVTGYTTQIASNTVYTRFLFLDAYDVATYVKENKMNQVWKTSVISTGSSNDLRLVVPYMVTAMKPYFGANTGRKVEVEILADDPAVQLLRSNQVPAIK